MASPSTDPLHEAKGRC